MIEARDHSYLEVQYTSTPLSSSSGIYDIFIFDESELLYLGGITEEITVGDDAFAVLKGGRMDYLTIGHLASTRTHTVNSNLQKQLYSSLKSAKVNLFIRITFQGNGPHGKDKSWSDDLKYENNKFLRKPRFNHRLFKGC